MARQSTGREKPELNALQLPEGGFEHPFHDSEDSDDDDETPYEGLKERPRIVSRLGFPTSLQVLNIASPVRRAADVCPLQFYQRKTQMVGENKKRGHR